MEEICNTCFARFAEIFSDSALWILFVTGFLSATLLPGGSEASLLATLSLGHHDPFSVILVATVRNTLGGLTNYGLGLWIPKRFHDEQHAHRALIWIERHGYWALLMAWLTVIGDPLCLAAGWLRMRVFPSLLAIASGKAARYVFLAAVHENFL